MKHQVSKGHYIRETKTTEGWVISNFGIWQQHMKTGNTRPCRECFHDKANSNPSNFVSSKVLFPSQLVNWKTSKVHVCRTKVIVKNKKKKTYPIKVLLLLYQFMQLNRRDYYKYLERVHYWIAHKTEYSAFCGLLVSIQSLIHSSLKTYKLCLLDFSNGFLWFFPWLIRLRILQACQLDFAESKYVLRNQMMICL